MQNNDYNPVDKEQDEPIEEDREDIEIPAVNEISYTESRVLIMRMSESERYPVEILEPRMKWQIYIQDSSVKNIDKQTKKVTDDNVWGDTNKNITQQNYIHNMVSQTAKKI